MKLDKSEISYWKCIRDSFRIGFSCRRTEKIVFNNLFKIYRLQNCQIGLLLQGEVSNRQKFPYWTTPGTYGRYVVFQFPQIKKKKKRTAPTGRKFPYWTTPATYVPWTLWNKCSTCFGHSTSSQVKCMGYYLTWVILYPPNTIQTLFYPKK